MSEEKKDETPKKVKKPVFLNEKAKNFNPNTLKAEGKKRCSGC